MGQLKGLAAIVKGGMSAAAEEEPVSTEEHLDERAHRSATQMPVRPASRVPAKKLALTKSKNPAWKAYSLFLKKETHSEMNFLLRKQDAGEDMSDLVQRLVEKWVAANR